jgi:hypothetical protein
MIRKKKGVNEQEMKSIWNSGKIKLNKNGTAAFIEHVMI